MTVTLRVNEDNINSDYVSVPQALLVSFVDGQVHTVEVRSKSTDALIERYRGKHLDVLMGSAISNGPKFSHNGSKYFLGSRSDECQL